MSNYPAPESAPAPAPAPVTRDIRVILLYGAAGVGKTTMIASLANTGRFGELYFVNADLDGIEAACGPDGNPRPGCHVSPRVRDVPGLQKQWDEISSPRRLIPKGVRTIVFDSFTAIDQRVIDFADLNPSTKVCEAPTMNMQTWGTRAKIIQSHVTKAFDLPYDFVIFVAHERMTTNAKGDIVETYPSVGSDRNQGTLTSMLSMIIHVGLSASQKRILTLQAGSGIVAKCRNAAIAAKYGDRTDKPLAEVLSLL